MAKEENQEMAKVSPTMCNLTLHQHQRFKTNPNKLISLLQHEALDIDFSLSLMMIHYMLKS